MNKRNNDIINKVLLVGDKLMPELHLWDSKVKKYSACDPFNKNTQRIQKFLNTGLLSEIYKNWIKQSDIVLKNKA